MANKFDQKLRREFHRENVPQTTETSRKIITLPEMITVGELAEKLNIPVVKLVGELFKNGIVATINQRIDFETAEIIIDELHLDVDISRQNETENEEEKFAVHLSENAETRPPIVAVMGHVDHGKTTLLDSIMKTEKVAGESGGITQHISAYQIEHKSRKITLLDTPGHEAFAALRQHGATLTDVVILVVAADDGVKPQTVEAIKFAKNANAKIVVAINKMDKESANPNLVKTQLATEYNLNPEEWGGDTVMVEISAKTGAGVDKLLDMVLLVADMEELKADYNVPAEGLVIESNLEQGRGAVVRVLVANGTLNQSDFLVAGSAWGKIRTLQDFAGNSIKLAGPSTPVTLTGFRELPPFGTRIEEVKNEREAKSLAQKHYDESVNSTANANLTGADLLKMMNRESEQAVANFIVKADVQGSLTSVTDSLKLLETDEVAVKIIASGVGQITEGDIRAARAADESTAENSRSLGGVIASRREQSSRESGAIIYGFNVNLPPQIKQLAARAKVEIRQFKIIYELLDDAKMEMEKLLPEEIAENPLGELDVKGVFRQTKEEVVAGGLVASGKIAPGNLARIWRKREKNSSIIASEARQSNENLSRNHEDSPENQFAKTSNLLAEAEILSVQREKNDAREVFEGEMVGLKLKLKPLAIDPLSHEETRTEKFTLEIGDRLEVFSREFKKRKL